jgi:hypothetical protein
MRGDYKSVTAAAIAAGLIKNDVNLRPARSAFGKMTPSRASRLHKVDREQSQEMRTKEHLDKHDRETAAIRVGLDAVLDSQNFIHDLHDGSPHP